MPEVSPDDGGDDDMRRLHAHARNGGVSGLQEKLIYTAQFEKEGKGCAASLWNAKFFNYNYNTIARFYVSYLL